MLSHLTKIFIVWEPSKIFHGRNKCRCVHIHTHTNRYMYTYIHLCSLISLCSVGNKTDAKTESWGFIMVEVGRNLWRSPGPTLLLKPGQLEQAAQNCVQMAPSKDGDSIKSLSNLCKALKKSFLCFCLCPLPH